MIEVKKLNLEPETGKTWVLSKQVKRTLIGILIGALVGFGYFYFSEGQYMDAIGFKDVLKSVGIGGFFGFFITNSPCARGYC